MEAIVETRVSNIAVGDVRWGNPVYIYKIPEKAAPWTGYAAEFEWKRNPEDLNVATAPLLSQVEAQQPIRVKIQVGNKKAKSRYTNMHGYYIDVIDIGVQEPCTPKDWRDPDKLSEFLLKDKDGISPAGAGQITILPSDVPIDISTPFPNGVPEDPFFDEVVIDVPWTNKPDAKLLTPFELMTKQIYVRQTAIDKAIQATRDFMVADPNPWTADVYCGMVNKFTDKFADVIWGEYRAEKDSE